MLLPHVDILFNTFQARQANNLSVIKIIENFERSVSCVRENIIVSPEIIEKETRTRSKTTRKELVSAAVESCDLITVQLKDRFENTAHTSSFVILAPEEFPKYRF